MQVLTRLWGRAMSSQVRLVALCALLVGVLTGCETNPYQPSREDPNRWPSQDRDAQRHWPREPSTGREPVRKPPQRVQRGIQTTDRPAPARSNTPQRQRSHPRYAPPPTGSSYWDARRGVYVIEGQQNLYYRERVYYRNAGGWETASNPSGPWRQADISSVPQGLR